MIHKPGILHLFVNCRNQAITLIEKWMLSKPELFQSISRPEGRFTRFVLGNALVFTDRLPTKRHTQSACDFRFRLTPPMLQLMYLVWSLPSCNKMRVTI